MTIYIDADACPVKNEVYRVAGRYNIAVVVVANSWMRTPTNPCITLKLVGDEPDAADNWIAETVTEGSVVITSDIPLADRCIKAHAAVLTPVGKEYTEDSIGGALAMRNLCSDLREAGVISGGPPPFSRRDRSRFLQKLDQIIQTLRRG